MPVCCRCNGGGRCRSCSCSRSGINCVDCLPLKRQRCKNTQGCLQQGVPENTRAETVSQAQRALTGDTEETRPGETPLGDTRQGGAAGCGTGNTVARSGEAKPTENGESGEQSLPPTNLHAPPTVPTFGAAVTGPQCVLMSLTATVRSSTGRRMSSGSLQGELGRLL